MVQSTEWAHRGAAAATLHRVRIDFSLLLAEMRDGLGR